MSIASLKTTLVVTLSAWISVSAHAYEMSEPTTDNLPLMQFGYFEQKGFPRVAWTDKARCSNRCDVVIRAGKTEKNLGPQGVVLAYSQFRDVSWVIGGKPVTVKGKRYAQWFIINSKGSKKELRNVTACSIKSGSKTSQRYITIDGKLVCTSESEVNIITSSAVKSIALPEAASHIDLNSNYAGTTAIVMIGAQSGNLYISNMHTLQNQPASSAWQSAPAYFDAALGDSASVAVYPQNRRRTLVATHDYLNAKRSGINLYYFDFEGQTKFGQLLHSHLPHIASFGKNPSIFTDNRNVYVHADGDTSKTGIYQGRTLPQQKAAWTIPLKLLDREM